MTPDHQHVMHLEQALLEPATRADRARLDALLAEDFYEVGANGLCFGKPEVLSALPSTSGTELSATAMQAATLSANVMLVTYTLDKIQQGHLTRSVRSSVWINGAHGWQMRYHQGTIIG